MRNAALSLTLLALLLATPAAASERANRLHSVAITFSPLHLIFPVLEVTGEFRVHRKVGLAAIIGGGTIGSHLVDNFDGYLLEFGASVRWYAVGDFDHGMQVGLEVLYAFLSSSTESVAAVGNGVGLAPFIGYKITAGVGFTFDAQVGPSIMFATAKAASSSGNTASEEDIAIGVMLNLNIGWAF